MKKDTNLPTVVNNKNNIFNKIKQGLLKTGKFAGYTIATGGLIIGGVLFPIVAVPAIIGAYFTGQKALNNSIYKEYNDLAFVTKKTKNKVTIAQDSTKIGVLKELRGLTDIEKYGFMQLQTIIGVSKFGKNDKNGKELTFNTKTHGINIKTFEILEKLGYINALEKKFYKQTSIPVEKLAFGNVKKLFEKKEFYDVNFKRTDKKLDINDEKLKKAFPIIFSSKKGLLTKKNYNFKSNKDGSLEIEYNKKNLEKANEYNYIENKLRKEINVEELTLKKQNENSKKILNEMNNEGNCINKEDNLRNI